MDDIVAQHMQETLYRKCEEHIEITNKERNYEGI